MKMMINCFCVMVDLRRRLRLISSRDHCQGFSSPQFSDMRRAGFELAQNLGSDFLMNVSCAVLITTKSQPHTVAYVNSSMLLQVVSGILYFTMFSFDS